MQQMNSDPNQYPGSQVQLIFKAQNKKYKEIVKKLRNLEFGSIGFNMQMIRAPEGEKGTDTKVSFTSQVKEVICEDRQRS